MISNPLSIARVSAGEQDELNQLDEQNNQNKQTDLSELVKGSEQGLVERLMPLVSRQSITLDMSTVRRIDAAGISALVSLYSNARAAGYRFMVANPSRRVAEILTLVGLERILLSHIAVVISQSSPLFQSAAA